MAAEAEKAMADASSNLVSFGYYTAVLILMGEEREELLDYAREIAEEPAAKASQAASKPSTRSRPGSAVFRDIRRRTCGDPCCTASTSPI